jgi:hypothetical protein
VWHVPTSPDTAHINCFMWRGVIPHWGWPPAPSSLPENSPYASNHKARRSGLMRRLFYYRCPKARSTLPHTLA